MSMAVYPIDDFINLPEFTIRVLIGKPEGGLSLHTGIIFKYKGEVHFLHLAWHHILKKEVPPDVSNYEQIKFLDFPFFDLKDESYFRRKAIIPYFLLVHELNNGSIPYAILYHSTKFMETGELDLGEGEFGLTCATFVLAIFQSKGINLIDTETWSHREEDNEFFDSIYGHLENHTSEDHKNHLLSNKECVRYRAEEVAASSTKYDGLPISFNQAEPLGVELKEILKN